MKFSEMTVEQLTVALFNAGKEWASANVGRRMEITAMHNVIDDVLNKRLGITVKTVGTDDDTTEGT